MKTSILIIFALLISVANAQPPCGTNPAAGNSCSTATPICELNGYCGNTSASYTANTWSQNCGFLGLSNCGLTGVFCGSIENNSFLSFTASATTISFNVWVTSSTLGYGIQILIFSANNCSGTVTQYGPCYNPGTVQPGPINITANGLTIGNTYYIMIDGNAGDVCNYIIGANTGISAPVDVTPETATICVGDNVALTATGGNGTFTWNATPQLNTTTGANVIATPPSPGVYTYTVNSSTGNPLCPSSTFATATITVNPCGCTTTATNSGSICPGGSVNLATTTVPGATYIWMGPGGFTSSQQNPTGVTPPLTPGTYSYTVTVTDATSTCTSTTIVTVNALPVVSAGTYSASCANAADITLVGSPLGGTFSGIGVTGNLFDPSVGTQTISYNYTDGNGCSNSNSTLITVNPMPIVNAGSYSAVCQNVLTVNLVGNPVGGVFSGTGVSGNVFSTTQGTQLLTYNYTDANGCSGSAQANIVVNPLPVVSAGAYSTLCASGLPQNLIGSPTGGVFSGTGVSANQFNPSVGTQTVTYTFTDANGCSSSATAIIVVNPTQTVDAGTYASVCSDIAAVSLVGSPTGGIFSGTGVTGNTFSTSQGTQTITYTYTDLIGCTSTDQVTVIVNPLPSINAGMDLTLCLGTNLALNGTGGISYSWDNGVTNGQQFSPSLGSTTYTLTGTDANGCTNTDHVTISVLNLPIAAISSNVTSGEVPLTVVFYNSSMNSSNYSWNFGNGQTSNASTNSEQSTVYQNIGDYYVIMIASNGICQDADTILIRVLPLLPPWINIPNVFSPNNDGSNDVFFLTGENIVTIEFMIFNRWGEFLHQLNGMNEFWNGTTKNGNEAVDGVYFYKYKATGISGEVLEGQGNITLIR